MVWMAVTLGRGEGDDIYGSPGCILYDYIGIRRQTTRIAYNCT